MVKSWIASVVRDTGVVSGLGICPGEGSSNPLQYSHLENSTERGAWWATVQGVTKSQTDWAHSQSVLMHDRITESWKSRRCLCLSLRHSSGAFLVILVGVAGVPYLDKQCSRASSVV